jgi:hypothetical protein
VESPSISKRRMEAGDGAGTAVTAVGTFAPDAHAVAETARPSLRRRDVAEHGSRPSRVSFSATSAPRGSDGVHALDDTAGSRAHSPPAKVVRPPQLVRGDCLDCGRCVSSPQRSYALDTKRLTCVAAAGVAC